MLACLHARCIGRPESYPLTADLCLDLTLPGAEGKKNGRPLPDDRKVLNGIFFVLRAGTPWRDLPERYGPDTTAYNRFNRWAKKSIWLRIFETLAAKSPQSLQLIDSSIIRAHRGGRDHIPTCPDREVQRSADRALYRQRNLIERFFNKLKHFRRIATRYHKTARNFLAAVLLAASRLSIRFESTT